MNINSIIRWFRFRTRAVRTTRYEILLPLTYNDGAGRNSGHPELGAVEMAALPRLAEAALAVQFHQFEIAMRQRLVSQP